MVQQLSDSTFEASVLQQSGVVLVDFWAPWCGPCRMVGPIVEDLAKDYAGKATIAKLNVDENQQTAMKYGIMSIPTLMIFKDGEPVDKIVGAAPKQIIAAKLDQYLDGEA
ncbi:MAG: thioredoxin [Firmicutes bacterium]|jgi:thioredoxin 1|nr:thioredoxin [Bacillota bacterium]